MRENQAKRKIEKGTTIKGKFGRNNNYGTIINTVLVDDRGANYQSLLFMLLTLRWAQNKQVRGYLLYTTRSTTSYSN